MFSFTTIIIICIFLIITYYIYQLLIDNLKLTKKLEGVLLNKIEDISDKLNETNELIIIKTDNLNTKIKECYDLEFKMNELNILNNQKIVEQHNYQEFDEQHNNNINNYNDENNDNDDKSPITENFFIKHSNNKDKELYYMSPVQKSSKNSNILSMLSKKSSSNSTSSGEELNDNISNINLYNNALNFCNIIVSNKNDNKNESNSVNIKDEDRVEEL